MSKQALHTSRLQTIRNDNAWNRACALPRFTVHEPRAFLSPHDAQSAPMQAHQKGTGHTKGWARRITTLVRYFALGTLLAGMTACGGGEGGAEPPVQLLPWAGVKQFGAASATVEATAVATNASGKVAVVGNTDGSIEGAAVTGSTDAYVSLYGSDGNRLWAKQFGSANVDAGAKAVAMDDSGNIYVTGYVGGELSPGIGNSGSWEMFLAKYDAAGNKLWLKQTGAAGKATWSNGLALDNAGNIYVASYTYGGLDGNTLTGTSDAYLTKYDSAGAKQWTKQLGSAGHTTFGTAVAVDNSNNKVYLAGYTMGQLDGSSTPNASGSVFLARYDTAGTKETVAQLGVAGFASTISSGAIAVTQPEGSVYIAGSTTADMFDAKIGTKDALVIKFDYDSVSPAWGKQYGAAGTTTYATGLAMDAADKNPYLLGYTTGAVSPFGDPKVGLRDSFVAKLQPLAGAYEWIKQFGVAPDGDVSGGGIAVNANAEAFVVGYTDRAFPNNTKVGQQDAFVAKFSGSGAMQ